MFSFDSKYLGEENNDGRRKSRQHDPVRHCQVAISQLPLCSAEVLRANFGIGEFVKEQEFHYSRLNQIHQSANETKPRSIGKALKPGEKETFTRDQKARSSRSMSDRRTFASFS